MFNPLLEVVMGQALKPEITAKYSPLREAVIITHSAGEGRAPIDRTLTPHEASWLYHQLGDALTRMGIARGDHATA